jgi:DNA-binding FadR family transcriptional regulator
VSNREPALVKAAAEDDRPRLHHKLMRTVLGEIANGACAPGERLPAELQLARDLDVSRSVIRELLRSLADRGVVSIVHGRGTWVNGTSEWDLLDADVLAALMPTPASVGVLTHYLECRRMLETEAAALAAERASSRDLSQMADALAQMSDLAVISETDVDADRRFLAADIAFHGAIFRATGNQVLPRLVEPIQRAMGVLTPQLALHPEQRLRTTLPEHKAILAAIADHQADAARATMAAHLRTIEKYLREYRMRREPAVMETDATVLDPLPRRSYSQDSHGR